MSKKKNANKVSISDSPKGMYKGGIVPNGYYTNQPALLGAHEAVIPLDKLEAFINKGKK